jgi:sugar lactone lactonase YvrE
MRLPLRALGAPLLPLLLSAPGAAQATLYGAADGTFHAIDDQTGAGTAIGPIGFGGVTGMVVLNDGRVLASASQGLSAILIEIDPATGVGSLLTAATGHFRYPDLAYDRASGRLWATANGPSELVELDPATGAEIAAYPLPGGNGRGLVWSAKHNLLFAVLDDDVYRIQPSSGTATLLSGLPSGAYSAIACDPTDGDLVASRFGSGGGTLVKLLEGTSVWGITTIGTAPDWLDALAYAPIPPAPGPPLLAAIGDYGLPSRLMRIDPETGFGTLIGAIGFSGISGMAVLGDGRLVASAVDPSDKKPLLIEIDRQTGQGALIGKLTGTPCVRLPGLTYDPLSDVLYGYAHDCAGDGLVRIDPDTAAVAPVGPSGFSGRGNGLAWSPSDGKLYATPDDLLSLEILSAATGASTTVPGSAGTVPTQKALAFHPETGDLFGAQRDAAGTIRLTSIHPGTGQVAVVGELPASTDALVFDAPYPAPAAGCDLRTGVLGLNPVDYACASDPVVGQTWTAQVQTAPLVGTATLATPVTFGLGGPTQGATVFGFELLILPPFLQIDGIGTMTFAIPAVPPLVGVTVASQASRFEVGGPGGMAFVLLNGQDLLLGL